jgi:hypothetical protein
MLTMISHLIRLRLRYTINFTRLVGISLGQFFIKDRGVNKNKISDHNVLIFMPEMGINLYSKVIEKIARTLTSSGRTVTLVRCNDALSNCTLKLGSNINPSDLSQICKNCVLNSKIVSALAKCKTVDLILMPAIGSDLSKLNYQELINFSYKSVPIGRLVYYDLSIHYKKDPLRELFYSVEKDFFNKQLLTAINFIDFLDNLQTKNNYSAVISFDEYCLANIVRAWARNLGLKAFQAGLAYHFNADLRFISLSSNKTSLIDKRIAIDEWKNRRQLALPAPLVNEIYEDLIFRMSTSGGHIFSKNYSGDVDSIKKLFKIKDCNRVIAVFPSSNDEITALEEMSKALNASIEDKDAFESQMDWLSCIIEFARQSDDVRVIIKIHPRLLDTHRDVRVADELAMYEEMATTLPDNVFFVWPKDSVSAYDILMFADLGLTSWGTMGLEIAKLGIPVVTALSKCVSVSPGINLFKKAIDKEDFLNYLRAPKYLVKKIDLIEACRWHYSTYLSNNVFCSDFISSDRKLHNLPSIDFNDILDGAQAWDKNYRFIENFNESNNSVVFDECQAIDASINKLIRFLEGDSNLIKSSKLSENLKLILNDD